MVGAAGRLMIDHNDAGWDHAIDEYVDYLRGQSAGPGLDRFTPEGRAQLAELFCTLDAITDMGFDPPPMAVDPARSQPGRERTGPDSDGWREHRGWVGAGGRSMQNVPRTGSPATAETTRSRRQHTGGAAAPACRRPRQHPILASGALPVVLLLILGLSAFPQATQAVAVVPLADARCRDLAVGSPRRVVVAAVWAGEERRQFLNVLSRFRARTGIDVTLATDAPTADRDLGRTLDDLGERGCAPDVALLPQPGLMADLARRHRLVGIDDVVGQEVDDNYSRAWRRLGTVDGTLYGAWFKGANKSIIWYSTQAFADASVAPPTTWESLKDVAARLAAAGTTPFAVAGQDGWTLTDWFENVYLRTAGPAMYERLARHEIPWTDASVKHALTTLAELLGRPEWISGGPNGALETSFERSVQQVFGVRREAAAVFEGDFVASHIPQADSGNGSGVNFFDFPSISGSREVLDWGASLVVGGDVAVLMRDHAPAKELIRFLVTAEAAESWVRAGGFTSPNRQVDLAWYPDEASRKAAQALTSATSVNFDLSDVQPRAFGSGPEAGMWKLMREFLANPGEVNRIAERLEEERMAVP
ncbi:MAG: ABC transporter substrate-binding protein [Acidimicrobiales bacterium]